MELPISYVEKMKKILGDDYRAYEESFQKEHFRGLRVNTLKVSVEEFEKISPFPLKKIPWISNGFYIPQDAKASKHPYYGAGLYYLQEPSAMTPANCLPVEPGDRVLDLCAAPGGKATELAAKLKGEGLLVANDISNSRAKALLKNLELFGARNILVTSETPDKLVKYFHGFFDKILIDAPCSGEGMFRKDDDMIKSWLEHGPEYYANLQKEIVEQAVELLAPGGKMLYSTCTFDSVENEEVIQHILNLDKGMEVIDLPAYEGFSSGRADLVEGGDTSLSKCIRLYPHKMNGEGHFTALLQKKTEEDTLSGKKKKAKEKEYKEWMDFSKNKTETCFDFGELGLYEQRLYGLPEVLANQNIRGLRFLRTGLYLGEIEKKRFEPSQALAMSLKKEDWKESISIPVEDYRVLRYLKGETVEVEDLAPDAKNGWYLVCVEAHPLGWGKVINGTLRNKLYPGWRW